MKMFIFVFKRSKEFWVYHGIMLRVYLYLEGLAFDWMTKNLYWTDSKYQWIMVARPDGRFQKKLINENLVDPVGIVVHPKRGYQVVDIFSNDFF